MLVVVQCASLLLLCLLFLLWDTCVVDSPALRVAGFCTPLLVAVLGQPFLAAFCCVCVLLEFLDLLGLDLDLEQQEAPAS